MEALSVDEIPAGDEWQYEPKWDGFRCLVFRDGDKVELQSKSGKPLTRYFPELVEAVRRAQGASTSCSTARSWCPRQGAFRSTSCCSASIRRRAGSASLPTETPALLIVFDLLADADGKSLVDQPLDERRKRLEAFAREIFREDRTHPAVAGDDQARRREDNGSSASARRSTASSPSGATCRTAPATAPACRRSRTTAAPTAWSAASATTKASRSSARCCSGLYDDDGLLHHVGFTSTIKSDGQAGADQEAGKADRAAGLHRQRAGRAEPLVDQALGRMAAAQAQARGRGLLRPFHRRPLPPRHAAAALAAGQGAEAMHARSGRAEEGGSDEAADVSIHRY